MTQYLAVHDALYGADNHEDLNMVQAGLQMASTYLANNEIGQNIISRARRNFDSYHGAEAMRRRALMQRNLDARHQEDNVIRKITTRDELQTANREMQAWIMCHPKLKRWRISNRINGYSESYKVENPDKFGKDDPRYQSLTDSVVMTTDEGWEVTEYSEVKHDLNILDKDAIMAAQRSVLAYAQPGKSDPTSKYNAKVV